MQDLIQLGQSNTIRARNYSDDHGNPASGYAHGPGLCIAWQDGPRSKGPNGELALANGAFVEDALAAAHQRLAFFESTKFTHKCNREALHHIEEAIKWLEKRSSERKDRGVLGQNVE